MLYRFKMIIVPGFLVIFFLCSFGFSQEKVPVTFDEFLAGEFSARSFNCRWLSGYECAYQDSNGSVILLDVASNTTVKIVNSDILSNISASDYSLSSDRQYTLLQYDRQAIFRHSIKSRYSIYGSISGKTGYFNISGGDLLSTARWTSNNGLVYVKDNDIYYIRTPAEIESPIRLTTTGIPDVVYNGIPDWVFEEEVIASGTSFQLSPNSSYLIYSEINDTNVPEMVYVEYGTPGTLENQYPQQIKIRYPKAGQRNPSYKLFLQNLADTNLSRITLHIDDEGTTIFTSFLWISDEEFIYTITNRVQNESVTRRCSTNALHFVVCSIINEISNSWGWVRDPVYSFTSDNSYFATIESVPVGNFGNFSHLVVKNGDGTSPRTLTSGQIAVTTIYGWFKNELIFFQSIEEGDPTHIQQFSVNVTSGVITCISCSITSIEGNRCTSSGVSFSTDLSYFVLTCTGPDPHFSNLYATSATLGEPIRVLEQNLQLREKLKTKIIPQRFNIKVPIGGNLMGDAKLYLPPNIDTSKKYPLLIEVYAGPDTTNTINSYGVGWESYLVGNLNIIYGLIDGRSSTNRGDDFLFAAYKSLGMVEILDQINGTRGLQTSLPWIDSNRTAIWGWSYGGYATGRALELDTTGVFKCGISVAPVTSWIYYDSIYTERYMGLPTEEDNLANYIAGDLVTNVSNLKNKRYLLVHGNADDNVHYQNSMMFARSLELADILFEQQSYPEENHSLTRVRRHLYHTMQSFIERCFVP